MKGTDTDRELDPATVDDKVTLTKDKLTFDSGSYLFEYRIKEVIPT